MIYVVVYNLFFAISFGMKLSSSVEKCDKISVFSNPIHLWVLKTALSDGLGGLESKALSVDGQKVWLFMQLLVANCPYQKWKLLTANTNRERQLSCCTAILVCIHITVVIAALFYVCREPVISTLILKSVHHHHHHHICNSAVASSVFTVRTPTSLALRSTQPLTEMSTRDMSWGVKTANPSYANCLDNLGTLTSGSCKGMSRPVMEYHYLYLYVHVVAVSLSVCLFPYFTCLAPLVHSLSPSFK